MPFIVVRIELQRCVMEDEAITRCQYISNEEVSLGPPFLWRMVLKSFNYWSSTEELQDALAKLGVCAQGSCTCPLPHFLSPSFHSSHHFPDILILVSRLNLLRKVWHLWSTFSHRSCNFGCIFYVFQIQVNLKVPASQVTLTLRTSQKMVSLAWDSGCWIRVHRSQQLP